MASTAVPVDRFAGEGAVEINHMQPFKALILEGQRLGCRVGIVNRRLVHIAELEANALPVLEVDGRKKDHDRLSKVRVFTASI